MHTRHTHAYVYTHTHTHIHTVLCTLGIYAYAHTHIHIVLCTLGIYAYAHTHIHTYTQYYAHSAYMHMHTCTYRHAIPTVYQHAEQAAGGQPPRYALPRPATEAHRPDKPGLISQYAPSNQPAAYATRRPDVHHSRCKTDRHQTASSLNAPWGGHNNSSAVKLSLHPSIHCIYSISLPVVASNCRKCTSLNSNAFNDRQHNGKCTIVSQVTLQILQLAFVYPAYLPDSTAGMLRPT